MSETELQLFGLLKEEVAQTFLENHNAGSHRIEEWKGQDITLFQEDLRERVKGQISEKWFYTHIKGSTGKLPRVDMLDLLSAYAGYTHWADFVQQNQSEVVESTPAPTPEPEAPPAKRSNRGMTWIFAVMSVAIGVIAALMYMPDKTYQICFTDADQDRPITGEPVEVLLLREGESPRPLQADSSGCLILEYDEPELQFVVRSPYYQTDTFTRVIRGQTGERIYLRTNDYALMIHLFSNSKVEDWEKRRKQLNDMIADHAQVVQIDKTDRIAIELYNKQEFIDKLTMPLSSLKNIEVLETIYEGSRIVKLRFRQKSQP